MAAKRRPRRSEPRRRRVRASVDTHRLVVILLEACERLRASRAILLALVRHAGRRRERPTQQRRLRQLHTPPSLLPAQHCPEPKRAGVRHPAECDAFSALERALRSQCCWRSSACCNAELAQTALARLRPSLLRRRRRTALKAVRVASPRRPWRRPCRLSCRPQRHARSSTPGAGASRCGGWQAAAG